MSDKILLVDDKTEIADLAEVYLRNENYEVLKYYSPKDVLAHKQVFLLRTQAFLPSTVDLW